MLTRRHAIGATLAASLAACAGKAGKVLNVGSQKGSTKSLMLAAGALDGAAYHVEWSEFPAAQNLLEALGSGAVDLGLVGDAPFQFAYASGSPIRAVAAMATPSADPGIIAILVSKTSSARTLADLIGRKIATTHDSIGHYVVLRALAAQGYKPDAVKLIFLSPSDSQAALQTGAVDGWSTWAPYTIAALAGGARVVVNGRDVAHGVSFDVASNAAIETKRDILKDFLRREAIAMRWALGQTDAFAKVLSHETGLPLPIAQGTARVASRQRISLTSEVIADQQTILDTFVRAGEVKPSRPIGDAFLALG